MCEAGVFTVGWQISISLTKLRDDHGSAGAAGGVRKLIDDRPAI